MKLLNRVLYYSIAGPMTLFILPMVVLCALMDQPRSLAEFKKNVAGMMDWKHNF